MSSLTRSKKCLFGGTVLMAGLMTQPASAQETFNLGTHYAAANAFDGFSNGFSNASGSFSISGSSMYGYAGSSAGAYPSVIYATSHNSYTGDWGQGFSRYVNFTVTGNGTATAYWDFTSDTYGTAGFYGSGIWLRDMDAATTIFSNPWDGGNNGNPVSGSVNIPLLAGVNYQVEIFSLSWGGGGSFGALSIPAPGSAALLGLAGIVAVRRRRT